MLALLQRKLRDKQVTVEKEYAGSAEALEVMAIAGEMRQVFWNLLANALDALGAGGRIRVRVAHSRDRRPGHDGGHALRVSVGDNGSGISSQAQARIFEPFFTTKSAGTGLGLWVASEILRKHGGSLRVRSSTVSKRRGTVFSLLIPAGPEREAGAAAGVEPAPQRLPSAS